MKTAKQHNSSQIGECSVVGLNPGDVVPVDALERLFESLGIKLTTAKVIRAKPMKPKKK